MYPYRQGTCWQIVIKHIKDGLTCGAKYHQKPIYCKPEIATSPQANNYQIPTFSHTGTFRIKEDTLQHIPRPFYYQ